MERRERRRFADEFKTRTVELIQFSGRTIGQVFQEVDLAAPFVTRWVEKAQVERGVRDGLTHDEHEELARLRRENRMLREEREILKRAAVDSTGGLVGVPARSKSGISSEIRALLASFVP